MEGRFIENDVNLNWFLKLICRIIGHRYILIERFESKEWDTFKYVCTVCERTTKLEISMGFTIAHRDRTFRKWCKTQGIK